MNYNGGEEDGEEEYITNNEYVDMMYEACELDVPVTYLSITGQLNKDTTPDTMVEILLKLKGYGMFPGRRIIHEYIKSVEGDHLEFLMKLSETISEKAGDEPSLNLLNPIPITEDEIKSFMERYDKDYEILLKNDQVNCNVLKNVVNKIEDVNSSMIGNPFFLKSSPRVTVVSYSSRIINSSNDIGSLTFDKLVISDKLFFARYMGDEEIFSKVFNGSLTSTKLDYDKLIKSKYLNKIDPNTMLCIIWTGDEDELALTRKDALHKVIFNFTTGLVTWTVPSIIGKKTTNYEQISWKIIKTSLGDLISDRYFQTSLVAEFDIHPVEEFMFEEKHFLRSIAIDPVYSNILSIDEKSYAYPHRTMYEYMYSPLMSMNFNNSPRSKFRMLFKNYDEEGEYEVDGLIYSFSRLRELFEELHFGEKLTKPLRYVRVRISEIVNVEEVEVASSILSVLFYMTHRDAVHIPSSENERKIEDIRREGIKAYDKRMKEIASPLKISVKTQMINIGSKLLKEYKQLYPDIFTLTYLSSAKRARVPHIFTTEEGAMEKAAVIRRKYKELLTDESILYLPFPVENPQFWFTSASGKYIFPTVSFITDRKAKYRYVPSSSKIDPAKNPNSDFNIYYRGKDRLTSIRGGILKSSKFLRNGDYGIIDDSLKNHIEINKSDHIYRLGTCQYPTPNSIIYCLMNACEMYTPPVLILGGDYDNYEKNVEKAEVYVTDVRRRIAEEAKDGLIRVCSQELYGIDTDEAITYLEGDDFIDSNLYYRILEEYFDVNIYVFETSENDIQYDIPRYRHFSARSMNNNRYTVILFKNYGFIGNKKNIQYPHYELVINGNRNPKKLFNLEVQNICHRTHCDVLATRTITGPLKTYNNVYNSISLHNMFGKSIVSQHVDAYGKSYAVDILFSNRQIYTVFTLPCQVSSAPQAIRGTFKLFNGDGIHKFIDNMKPLKPNAIARDSQGNMVGYWFEYLKVHSCFFIGCTPIKFDTQLPVGGNSPMYKGFSEGKELKTYQKTKRSASILKHLIQWIFSIWRIKSEDELPNEVFINKYIKKSDKIIEYNFEKLSSVLPKINTVEDGIFHINKGVVLEIGPIYLYDNVIRMLHHMRNNSYPIINRKINGYYATYEDFTQMKNMRVFATDIDFRLWYSDMAKDESWQYRVHNQVTLEMSMEIQPYLLNSVDREGRHLYLVQNAPGIAGSELTGTHSVSATATWMAKVWKETGRNPGYYGKPQLEKTTYVNGNLQITRDINYVTIYNIGQSNTMYPVDNVKYVGKALKEHHSTEMNEEYLKILKYQGSGDIVSERFRTAALNKIM